MVDLIVENLCKLTEQVRLEQERESEHTLASRLLLNELGEVDRGELDILADNSD